MAVTPRYQGFVPGLHAIDGYGSGGFAFAGMSHVGSILALPSGIRAWSMAVASGIDEAALAPLFAEEPGSIEFLVVGTGASLELLPRVTRELLRARGLRFDPMATGHAVSTYNILLGERRKVAAALIACP